MEHVTDNQDKFHDILQVKIDAYVHLIYAITNKYPKEELFGSSSQHKRAALSIALNYIEGFARFRYKVQLNFLEIAFGSLKESQYLLKFANRETWINEDNYSKAYNLGDEIARMLWATIRKMS